MRSIDAFRCAFSAITPELEGPAKAVLEPLMRYDRDEGGDLMKTLALYLRLNGNASRSAQGLYLHRSGLLYRIARIESLLGVQLDEPDDRLALEVALACLSGKTSPDSTDLSR